MSDNGSTAVQSIDVEERDVRALTQYLTVLPDGPDLFEVVSQSGKAYTVDVREGACSCPDFEYREARCKHQRRVAFATGERPIPDGFDPERIDDQLGIHVTPQKAERDVREAA